VPYACLGEGLVLKTPAPLLKPEAAPTDEICCEVSFLMLLMLADLPMSPRMLADLPMSPRMLAGLPMSPRMLADLPMSPRMLRARHGMACTQLQ
jgi:hypothetical protein